MRPGLALLVSSALLSLLAVPGPHPHAFPGNECHPSTVSGRVLISEFYPCGLNQDEYFVIVNTADDPVALANWSVSDGEGVIRFLEPASLAGRGMLAVSMNSSSYERAYGGRPDIGLDDATASAAVHRSGTFALANGGDSISLVDASGAVVDCVRYGKVGDSCELWHGAPIPALRDGEVARRIQGSGVYTDTDSSTDWMPFREYRYGYTDIPSIVDAVPQGAITAFTSPDCALEVFLETVESAQESLRVCAYEITSPELCGALLDALARGVEVAVLVDGAPAGGIDEREANALSLLSSAGARTMLLSGRLDDKVVQHFSALHAKYVVADGLSAIVTSENFVEGSLSADPIFGTRGWGVRIESPALARYLARLFDDDSRADRPDVREWRRDARYDPSAALPAAPARGAAAGILRPMRTTSDAIVRLLVSPDASVQEPYLVPLLEASTSALVQQFQADLLWQTRWSSSPVVSPLVAAALVALGQGGSVMAQLDSTWFNLERNGEVLQFLTANAMIDGSDGHFAFAHDASPIRLLHNKGLVLDERRCVVSSNNWVYASFARNRELAAVIESPEVAEYFARAFRLDWYPDQNPPEACAGQDVRVGLGALVELSGAGSTDDRCIVSWSWDADGDGRSDAQGVTFAFVATRPGVHTVVLRVVDSWGNAAEDEVVVEVVYASDPTTRPNRGSEEALLPVLLAGAMVGAVVARARLRRRLARRPRKINHPRLGSEDRAQDQGVLAHRHALRDQGGQGVPGGGLSSFALPHHTQPVARGVPGGPGGAQAGRVRGSGRLRD